MDPHDSRQPVNDDALHALLDGRVSAAERVRLEARLMDDPAAAASLAAFREQRDALRGLHSRLLDEPVPPP